MIKERFKIALEETNLTALKVAEAIGLRADTLRKAINRNSINDGYLILIEQKCGISKKWLKEGIKPVVINRTDSIKKLFDDDLLKALESVDKDMIVAYMLLRQDEFLKLTSFRTFVDKLKISEKISKIIEDE